MRTPRRPRWPWLVGALLVVGAWSAAAALSLAGARGQLATARDAAAAGRDALLAGDVVTAEAELARARDSFHAGERRLSSPFVRAFEVVAPVYDDLVAARALALAGALVAEAGQGVAATVTGFDDGLAALEPEGGALPVDRLAALSKPLARAEALLAEADALVGAVPTAGLTRPVADARADFVTQLAAARGLVEPAATLASVLPSFLGADEPRRYFFAAQNPAELRGTGGYIGAFAILTVEQGRLSFGEFREIQELPNAAVSDVAAPSADYAARFNRYGGAAFWQNLNMTLDFPSAAVAIERLYAHAVGDELDGVIAADPFALAALLEVAGPIDVPLIGEVTADNVVHVMTNQAYAVFEDPAQRKAVLGGVAAGALTGFLAADGEGARLGAVRTLARAGTDGHLLLHAADPAEQAAWLDLGVAGAFDDGGGAVGVAVNNAAANKADYYSDREVRYEVRLQRDGSADGVLTLRLSNGAPTSGVPRYVIGPNRDDLEAGANASIVSVYCPAPCALQSAPPGTRTEHELDHAVFTSAITLRSGEQAELSYSWRQDDAWDTTAYRLALESQPTVRPTAAELVVTLPPELRPIDVEGAEVDGTTVRWDHQLGKEHVLTFAVTAADARREGAPDSWWQRVRDLLSTPLLRFGSG